MHPHCRLWHPRYILLASLAGHFFLESCLCHKVRFRTDTFGLGILKFWNLKFLKFLKFWKSFEISLHHAVELIATQTFNNFPHHVVGSLRSLGTEVDIVLLLYVISSCFHRWCVFCIWSVLLPFYEKRAFQMCILDSFSEFTVMTLVCTQNLRFWFELLIYTSICALSLCS